MEQKYIVRKIKRFSGLGCFFWLLYQYDPESDTYCFVGRHATLGQLVCAMGGDEIENWHFISQATSPSGYVTVTCYSYTKKMGSCNVEIRADVIEKSSTERNQNEEGNQITCKLSPDELHKILLLLHSKKVEIQNDLVNSGKPIDTGNLISLVEEVAFLDRLSGNLNQKMRQRLKKHPNETYGLLH